MRAGGPAGAGEGAGAHLAEPGGHVGHQPLARRGCAQRAGHGADRGPQIGERAVVDHQHAHAGALDGAHRLAVPGRRHRDHQVGARGERHLDARHEVAAHARDARHRRRVVALRAHAYQPLARAERVHDLGDGRRERDDACRRAGGRRGWCRRAAPERRRCEDDRQPRAHADAFRGRPAACQRAARASRRPGSSGQLPKVPPTMRAFMGAGRNFRPAGRAAAG